MEFVQTQPAAAIPGLEAHLVLFRQAAGEASLYTDDFSLPEHPFATGQSNRERNIRRIFRRFIVALELKIALRLRLSRRLALRLISYDNPIDGERRQRQQCGHSQIEKNGSSQTFSFHLHHHPVWFAVEMLLRERRTMIERPPLLDLAALRLYRLLDRKSVDPAPLAADASGVALSRLSITIAR